MDIVSYLREQAITDCVAYTEFMLQYKKGKDILYCFFEGVEDRIYYSNRIQLISTTEEYTDFICGGKGEVLKVYNLIKANDHYKVAKTGFFVDKDFDERVYPSDIYVTPCYSIENLYCHEYSVEKILVAEFGLKRETSDLNKCIEKYIELRNEFNEKVFVLNSWLACQADYRNNIGTSTRLKIDDRLKAVFDKIVKSDLSGLKDFSTLQTQDDIEKIFVDAPKISAEDLEKKIEKFKEINRSQHFRGKLLIRFFVSFFCRIQSLIASNSSCLSQKYSCNLRFEVGTVCSNLVQYAETFKCFKDYVRNIS